MVDDDPTVLDTVQAILLNEGYEVLTAADGQEGWAVLSEQTVDLVVTDEKMPRMKGHELAKRIKAVLPTLPIVMLTGVADPPVTGPPPLVERVVSKPFDFADFVAVIRKLLAQH